MTSPTYHNPDNLDSPGEGWRFLLQSENPEDGDEVWTTDRWMETLNAGYEKSDCCTYRTRRPLPTQTETEVKSCAPKPSQQSSCEQSPSLGASNAAEGSPTLPSQPQPSDGEMLDWLEKQGGDIDNYVDGRLTWTLTFLYPHITDDGSESLRAAVAAAMKEGK